MLTDDASGFTSDLAPVSASEFASLMARLGPWPVDRRVAVAVSGGADSLALALLVNQWARLRAKPVALVVDHGLRPESGADARWTEAMLRRFGIPAHILRLEGLASGPGLQERARRLRYAALRDACARAGLLDLLLGHHRGDQEETMIMRAASGSGPDGRAGMATVSERSTLRLVRPLLTVPPARLRATLRASAVGWLDDPSNADRRFARVRLRQDFARTGRRLIAADDPVAASRKRSARAAELAAFCARHVTLREEGVAFLPEGMLPEAVLARLLQALSGAEYPPPRAAVARLAASPRPATLYGVRLARSRLTLGLLAFREAAAMDGPVAARLQAVWDGRFRLLGDREPPPGWVFGALGAARAARLRRHSPLPAAALATLPALIDAAGEARVVPHLGIAAQAGFGEFEAIFAPRVPVAPSFFTSEVDA